MMKQSSPITTRPWAALALAGLLALAPAAGARAETAATSAKAEIARVESYLNGIRTMTSRFVQLAPNGGVAEGTIYLQRPGKMRVEYDPPVPILLVADGGLLSYYDKDLDELKQMPLQQSSAWFLVRYPIKLTDGITVSHIDRSPGGLQISLYQTDEPDAG